MSEFNAKIIANIDTSKAEAQLNALTKERKVNVQANVNGNGVDNLNNSMQQAQKKRKWAPQASKIRNKNKYMMRLMPSRLRLKVP